MVEKRGSPLDQLYLVGSADVAVKPFGATPDTCVMDQSILNLHISKYYEVNSTAVAAFTNTADWTISSYKLEFDAFKLGGSTDLKLTCDFQLCLNTDCPLDSALTKSSCP